MGESVGAREAVKGKNRMVGPVLHGTETRLRRPLRMAACSSSMCGGRDCIPPRMGESIMGDSWVAMGQGQPSGGGVTVTLCVGGDEDKSRGSSPVLSGMQVRTMQAARLKTVNRTGSRAVWCAMMDDWKYGVLSSVWCVLRTWKH